MYRRSSGRVLSFKGLRNRDSSLLKVILFVSLLCISHKIKLMGRGGGHVWHKSLYQCRKFFSLAANWTTVQKTLASFYVYFIICNYTVGLKTKSWKNMARSYFYLRSFFKRVGWVMYSTLKKRYTCCKQEKRLFSCYECPLHRTESRIVLFYYRIHTSKF